jgi:hypothetical protein
MDELVLEGRTFISARRAAKEHGYAPDYIGQLIRGGKLEGRKVGRGWFVELSSLNSYMGKEIWPSSKAEQIEEVPAAPEETIVKRDEAQRDEEEALSKEETPVSVVMRKEFEATRKNTVPSTASSRYPLLQYLSEDDSSLPTLQKPPSKEFLASLDDFESMDEVREELSEPEEIASKQALPLLLSGATLVGLLLFLAFTAVSEWQVSYDSSNQSAASYLSVLGASLE